MPNHFDNPDPPEDDDAARLDAPAQVERSWSGVGLSGGPLTTQAHQRIVTGGQTRAVAAAQAKALLALLKALAPAVPRVDTADEEAG